LSLTRSATAATRRSSGAGRAGRSSGRGRDRNATPHNPAAQITPLHAELRSELRSEPQREAASAPNGLRPSTPGQELICSLIGLSLKLGIGLVALVSLARLAGAYQERLDRYGEIRAVLDIQQAKLMKAQHRFDQLFSTGGEQKLIQEQDQWIAPNRMRVVWKQPQPQGQSPFPTVEQPGGNGTQPQATH